MIATVPADQYHVDEFHEQPSLSASIASLICSRSPRHAWAAHPRLGSMAVKVDKTAYDIGTVAHRILLEGEDDVLVVDADSWRTNAAKEQADLARSSGRVPLLVNQYADVCRMVEAVREQLPAEIFTDGKPEQTMVWEEDDVVMRARPDWLYDDHRGIADIKTTSTPASVRSFEKHLVSIGCDVQAAFYLRGLAAITESRQWAEWIWVVVETKPPYVVSLIKPAADLLELGHRKVEFAVKKWRECLASGVWPAYSSGVEFAHAPEWEMARWLEREEIAA